LWVRAPRTRMYSVARAASGPAVCSRTTVGRWAAKVG
jgi:hypothetical protein